MLMKRGCCVRSFLVVECQLSSRPLPCSLASLKPSHEGSAGQTALILSSCFPSSPPSRRVCVTQTGRGEASPEVPPSCSGHVLSSRLPPPPCLRDERASAWGLSMGVGRSKNQRGSAQPARIRDLRRVCRKQANSAGLVLCFLFARLPRLSRMLPLSPLLETAALRDHHVYEGL